MLRVTFLVSIVVLALSGAAHAQAPVLATNGSALQAPANLALPGGANQCLARPYIGVSAGQIQFLNTGQSTCMWWSTQYGPAGEIIANTYVPRGAGAVTKVRVRSQASPAPLQFAILGSGSGLCCTTKQLSPVFQPAPNTVSEFAVNLPAGSGVGTTPGSQFNDILTIVAVGPGSLPVNDRGTHGFLFGSAANQAQASFLHPALALGASNTDVGIMDGYEVLLQYDWCGVPLTLGAPQPVAPADPTTACLPGGGAAPPADPGTPTPPTPPVAAPNPLRALSATASVRSRQALLRLRCLLTATCTGTVALRPRGAGASAAKVVSYGTARYRIGAGKSATVRVKLAVAARSALKRKRRVPVSAVVTAGGSSWTLSLTLKR